MTNRDHDDEVRPYASPVCYAHEFETDPMPIAEVVNFLNTLLEGERAGAQGLIDMAKTTRRRKAETAADRRRRATKAATA